MKRFLLFAITCACAIAATAQSPTFTTNVQGCTVFKNFDKSNEGFSSPSIYSDANDAPFFWNSAAGAEIENSGLNGRINSLLSPVYILNETGQTTIGFRYQAPAGTIYRIRVISAVTSPPLEVLASTANGPVYTALPNTEGNICVRLTDQNLIAGRAIRFEFTFRVKTGTATQIVLFDDLSAAVALGPLPVTFEGFVARKLNDGETDLLWNVSREVNVKGYYVETSTNGVNFQDTAYVTASGKSIYKYNYADKISGTVFFRIRNIDFDGKSRYSIIIKINGKGTTLSSLQIYPQLAFEQVTIQHNKATEKAMLTLYSGEDKIMIQKLALPNTLQTQININNLNSDLYVLRYDDESGKVQSKSLIKN